MGILGCLFYDVHCRIVHGRDGVDVRGLPQCYVEAMLIIHREPTAGGQYAWVSVFAPERWKKPASYIVGPFNSSTTCLYHLSHCFKVGCAL
jgi:hypothetical protein